MILCCEKRCCPTLSKFQANLATQTHRDDQAKLEEVDEEDLGPDFAPGSSRSGATDAVYEQSKLGARSGESPYQVDYDALLQVKSHAGKVPLKKEEKLSGTERLSYYPLSLTASSVKQYTGKPYECEFNPDEMAHFRHSFLESGEDHYFLGFEMVHAVFKKERSMKAFVFPLFYMPVRLKQSKRQLFLEPIEGGRFYLNHIALANLTDSFAGSTRDGAEAFFNSLLAQRVRLKEGETRAYLSRTLPVKEEYFKATREILFGEEGADGKRGLFASLKLAGVECDIEDCYLYRVGAHLPVMAEVLDRDLDRIMNLATENKKPFQSSLLGQFLSQEKIPQPRTERSIPWMPEALPKSMQKLHQSLHQHNLVVLEGPPGTGKTHTIRNLLVHALCTGQRLLVVSDRASAVEALEDKLMSFFVDELRDEKLKSKIEKLWRGVLPIMAQMPVHSHSLKEISRFLQNNLNLDEDLSAISGPPEDLKGLHSRMKKAQSVQKKLRTALAELMSLRQTHDAEAQLGTAQRSAQPSDEAGMARILRFAEELLSADTYLFQGHELKMVDILRHYLKVQERMKQLKLTELYGYFSLRRQVEDEKRRQVLADMVHAVKKAKPRDKFELRQALSTCPDEFLIQFVVQVFRSIKKDDESKIGSFSRVVRQGFRHPLAQWLQQLEKIQTFFEQVRSFLDEVGEQLTHEVQGIHDFFDPHQGVMTFPLALELLYGRLGFLAKIEGVGSKAFAQNAQELLKQMAGNQKSDR